MLCYMLVYTSNLILVPTFLTDIAFLMIEKYYKNTLLKCYGFGPFWYPSKWPYSYILIFLNIYQNLNPPHPLSIINDNSINILMFKKRTLFKRIWLTPSLKLLQNNTVPQIYYHLQLTL